MERHVVPGRRGVRIAVARRATGGGRTAANRRVALCLFVGVALVSLCGFVTFASHLREFGIARALDGIVALARDGVAALALDGGVALAFKYCGCFLSMTFAGGFAETTFHLSILPGSVLPSSLTTVRFSNTILFKTRLATIFLATATLLICHAVTLTVGALFPMITRLATV